MEIQKIRKDFPIVQREIFLNHAATSPLPRPVAEAMKEYIDKRMRGEAEPIDLEEGRLLFASLIGAGSREIAIIPNTSTGLNMVANMLKYHAEANIVTTDLEFPTVTYPWLRKGLKVDVRYVESLDGWIPIEGFEEAIDDDTVVVAISHVEYTSGFRNDLEAIAEIAHEHGALIMVDAIQSVGALRVDVKRSDIDFLAASTYKWILGPTGIGFMYIREELINRFEPPFVGYAGVKPEVFETIDLWNNRELILRDDAGRFEVSDPGMVNYVGAVAALKLLLKVGIDRIERRILRLTGTLIDELEDLGFWLQTPRDDKSRSGIVNFRTEDPGGVVSMLRSKGIRVSARAFGVRVSPHFYNTEDEIYTLIQALKDL